MAESDFTLMTDSLDAGSIARGVTAGVGTPSGGGSFVYAFNSRVTASGAAALFTNQVNFAPTAKGGSVSGVLKRGVGGGTTGFSPLLFINAGGSSVNDTAYLVGLSDGDPSHIVLAKKTIVSGVPDAAPDPTSNGILLRSSKTIEIDEWVHLRLDAIVNDNGDVILQVFENDLVANPIGTPPVWTIPVGMEGAVAGINGFIDDVTEINSGSAPLTAGRMGFGFQSSDVTRRGFIDAFEAKRQV